MKICTYLESKEMLTKTGIMSAYRNHQRALDAAELLYTEDPNDAYDVLHLHWIGPKSYYHLRRAKRTGMPVVITAHSTAGTCKGSVTFSELINPLIKSYLWHIYNQVDLVIAPSLYTKRLLQEQGITPPIQVISNGIDFHRLSPDPLARDRFRRKFGLTRCTVLSVGQVIPRKGVMDFLDVAECLPQFDFIWVGERLSPLLSFYPQMHRRVKRAPANVRFPGFFERVEEAYAGADIFFFPSQEETQGMVVFEAAAMQLPIVLRDIPIYQDSFVHGVHCLKGSHNDEFIQSIKRLATNEELRRGLGSESFRLAQSHRLNYISSQYTALYQTLLARKGLYVTVKKHVTH